MTEWELSVERAKNAHLVRTLVRIHSFISPADVRLPDGRVFRFDNPAIQMEMLRGLSDAIRAVPAELDAAAAIVEPADRFDLNSLI
jgi:hypothetical protein